MVILNDDGVTGRLFFSQVTSTLKIRIHALFFFLHMLRCEIKILLL